MRNVRRILTMALVLLLLISAVPVAQAADSSVTYAGRSAKFIFAPGTRYSLTDLFPNFKDVMPGDTITQDITVRNKAYQGVKVKIYMRALGAHKSSEEFLSQMNLTVVKKTDTIMFDAPASQTANLSEWTYLGTLYSGGKADLSVVLKVPVEMDSRFENAVGYLDWQFLVEEHPIEYDDPKTGDTIFYAAAVMTASAAGLMVLFFLYKKKKAK